MRLHYSPSGVYAPKRNNVNRFLPQGGFQSVNASITAQEQCKVPIPQDRIPNPDSMDDAGDMFGHGSQDVIGEARGRDDIVSKVQQMDNNLPNDDEKLILENGTFEDSEESSFQMPNE